MWVETELPDCRPGFALETQAEPDMQRNRRRPRSSASNQLK
jgi:hypothetical protein